MIWISTNVGMRPNSVHFCAPSATFIWTRIWSMTERKWNWPSQMFSLFIFQFNLILFNFQFLDNLAGDEGSDNNQKLDNILFKFGHRGILQCAQGHWNRVICLFSLFADKSKFVQFKARHKLSTTYALLQYVISEEIDGAKVRFKFTQNTQIL